MSTMELVVAARTFREILAQIKELEAKADDLKQQMIKEMDAQKTEELRAGEYIIRYTLYESRRLDTKALQKALPEMAERFTKTTTSMRFQVV